MDKSMETDGDVGNAKELICAIGEEPQELSTKPAPDIEEYIMQHPKRGKCLIFNNKEFLSHLNLNLRNGTGTDVLALHRCFRRLNFEVIIHDNFAAKQILDTLKAVAKEDHTESDCFVCCILTHGGQGVLYGKDRNFSTEYVFEPFQGDVCPTLAAKPKLFFIQACQGDRVNKGVLVKTSADGNNDCKISTQADFLISYSTVPGFLSWRNETHGSWFIQALCKILEKYSTTTHLQDMMTRVCRKVAYEYESCVPDNPDLDQMKQVPYIISTLTRKIFFSKQL